MRRGGDGACGGEETVGELSGRGIVRSGNCPVGELSGRGIVRSGNCPSGNCPGGELSVGELSVGELSGRGIVRIPLKRYRWV